MAERPFRQYDFTRRSIWLIRPGRRLTDDKQEQRHQQRAKTWIFHIKSRPVPVDAIFLTQRPARNASRTDAGWRNGQTE